MIEKVKRMRFDNGGEFTSTEFQNYFKNIGVIFQTIVQKTPEHNGLSDSKNRTLIETIRYMFSDAKFPKTFWAEASSTTNYFLN